MQPMPPADALRSGAGEPFASLRRIRALFTWLFAGALGTAGLAAAVAVAAPPGRDGGMAAFFPPWWSQAEAFAAAAAAGDVLGTGGWPTVVILRANQPDMASRLRKAGAMIVMDATAALCGGSEIPRTN